jgi:hypothetical protein
MKLEKMKENIIKGMCKFNPKSTLRAKGGELQCHRRNITRVCDGGGGGLPITRKTIQMKILDVTTTLQIPQQYLKASNG